MGGYSINARFFAPPEALAGCFTSFYLLECDSGDDPYLDDMLQPEWGNLRFFLGAAPEAQVKGERSLKDTPFTATGPSTAPIRFRLRSTRMWGVGLLPLGWAKFIGLPACNFVNGLYDGLKHPAFAQFVRLFDRLSASTASDKNQADLICDHFLALDQPVRDAERIATVHEALLDPSLNEVGTMAERTGMNRRTLERICTRHFGFPPQLLIRRQRMMRSLAAYMLEHGARWSEVIDTNYHDQAHFSREFHAFMGISPSEYGALHHPVLGAFMEARKLALGSPVQTLDPPHPSST
ncbi:helix-turn-helix domain-containing protein [Porphyrobacter algicida]|uniref:Helix-turn-helix domain-containing protein n=1 Tax=Qipengyuania algicida TaxID=1836209 RepID=A0A845ADS2_9SPHN|nr:helix-turn-helix domain-containing protein [Qipengyuania algicida]MXP27834.1 helix-turn-helix domain-containing protein [Qipengyuania algicida]